MMTLDPSVNLGQLITAVSFALGGLAVGAKWRDGLRDTFRDVESMRADLKEVKFDVAAIKVIQQSLSDGKSRMDSMEARLLNIEAHGLSNASPRA